MKELIVDLSKTVLEQEAQVIEFFRDNNPGNAKKLLKMIIKAYPGIPPHIQKSFCDPMLNPKNLDKLKILDRYVNEMEAIPKLIAEMKAKGDHGMIIKNNTSLHGISLKTSKKWLSNHDQTAWTEEQENEIIDEALDAWMIANAVRHYKGKVVLFSQFGFSGVARLMDVRMDDESWEAAKHQKLNAELKQYLQG